MELEGLGRAVLSHGSPAPCHVSTNHHICSFFRLKENGVTPAGLFGLVRRATVQQGCGQHRSPRCDAASWPGLFKRALDQYLVKKRVGFFLISVSPPQPASGQHGRRWGARVPPGQEERRGGEPPASHAVFPTWRVCCQQVVANKSNSIL